MLEWQHTSDTDSILNISIKVDSKCVQQHSIQTVCTLSEAFMLPKGLVIREKKVAVLDDICASAGLLVHPASVNNVMHYLVNLEI